MVSKGLPQWEPLGTINIGPTKYDMSSNRLFFSFRFVDGFQDESQWYPTNNWWVFPPVKWIPKTFFSSVKIPPPPEIFYLTPSAFRSDNGGGGGLFCSRNAMMKRGKMTACLVSIWCSEMSHSRMVKRPGRPHYWWHYINNRGGNDGLDGGGFCHIRKPPHQM